MRQASRAFSVKLDALRRAIKANFDPNQPRDDRGRWTDTGGSIPRELVDSAQWASGRRRGPTHVTINGKPLPLTQAQSMRLAVAEGRAREAAQKVREIDPNWRPTPSLRENVEGHIRAVEAEAREAEARIAELRRAGIGPGRFSGESIPARGTGRNFTTEERREINRIGREMGCHTCGTKEPGTPTENFILDHQLPNAWNPLGKPQRLYPHCLTCSLRQGGWIRSRGSRQ